MNNDESKIALITRIKSEDEKKEEFQKWLEIFIVNQQITKIYIISDELNKIDYDKKVKFIKVNNPTSSISMNSAIAIFSKNISFFIVASREVKEIKVEELVLAMKHDNQCLVTGYKFHLKNKKLNHELQIYYKNEDFIAYQVPWNTCAIWNYELFKNYVKKFDKLTDENPFDQICVCIDKICRPTDHKGMEDGLAIAKAASQENSHITFRLLDHDTLLWDIKNDYNSVKKHREKLARKDTVLRDFMAVRDYSVENLMKAKDK